MSSGTVSDFVPLSPSLVYSSTWQIANHSTFPHIFLSSLRCFRLTAPLLLLTDEVRLTQLLVKELQLAQPHLIGLNRQA